MKIDIKHFQMPDAIQVYKLVNPDQQKPSNFWDGGMPTPESHSIYPLSTTTQPKLKRLTLLFDPLGMNLRVPRSLHILFLVMLQIAVLGIFLIGGFWDT